MGLFGGSKDPEDLINSAMSLMQRKQPKAAVSLFKKALKNDPENVIAPIAKPKLISIILPVVIMPPAKKAAGFLYAPIATKTAARPTKL